MKNLTKKFTLVFDGNYFFFKTLYVIPNLGDKLVDSDEDIKMYISKLSTDFASIIKKFSLIVDQVVFTLDSSSWRKDYFPELEYKGNRKSDDSINWDNFSECMKIFTGILESKGVIINRVSGAEGDDLCYSWSTYCNNKNKSCIIFSGDRDLMQLVDYYESTNAATVFYSSAHNKLVVYKGFNKFLKESSDISIFNMSSAVSIESNTRKTFSDILSADNLKIEEINSSDFVFKKILTGDKGDNIKSVYNYTKATKAGQIRNYGISENKATIILDESKRLYGDFNLLLLFNEQYKNNIINLVIRIMKANKMSKEQMLENLHTNTNLILLHAKTLPEQLQEKMYSTIESDFSKVTNITNLNSHNIILENTPYIKVSKTYGNLKNEKGTDLSFIKDRKEQSGDNSLF